MLYLAISLIYAKGASKTIPPETIYNDLIVHIEKNHPDYSKQIEIKNWEKGDFTEKNKNTVFKLIKSYGNKFKKLESDLHLYFMLNDFKIKYLKEEKIELLNEILFKNESKSQLRESIQNTLSEIEKKELKEKAKEELKELNEKINKHLKTKKGKKK